MKKNIILAYGNKEFNDSLFELKEYLKFDLEVIEELDVNKEIDNFKGFLVHEDSLDSNFTKNLLLKNKSKIIIFYRIKKIQNYQNIEKLMLPTTIDQINNLVMKNIIKTEFRSNSSLKINNYILDKNSRRLVI